MRDTFETIAILVPLLFLGYLWAKRIITVIRKDNILAYKEKILDCEDIINNVETIKTIYKEIKENKKTLDESKEKLSECKKKIEEKCLKTKLSNDVLTEDGYIELAIEYDKTINELKNLVAKQQFSKFLYIIICFITSFVLCTFLQETKVNVFEKYAYFEPINNCIFYLNQNPINLYRLCSNVFFVTTVVSLFYYFFTIFTPIGRKHIECEMCKFSDDLDEEKKCEDKKSIREKIMLYFGLIIILNAMILYPIGKSINDYKLMKRQIIYMDLEEEYGKLNAINKETFKEQFLKAIKMLEIEEFEKEEIEGN